MIFPLAQAQGLAELPTRYLAPSQTEVLYLTDLPAIDWQVRMTTSLGSFDVNLRNDAAPATVRNFLNYVVSGAYNQGMVHRSVPNFVIQGGGYQLIEDGEDFDIFVIPNTGTVPGEFQLPNLRGTMAMALVGGDPNSGTTQWFINVGDNPGLDNPANGPFTVFGEILPPGMTLVDSINALTRVNFSGAFNETPMVTFEQGRDVVFEDFVGIPSVTLLNPPQIISITPANLIQATLQGDRLELSALPGAAGTSAVTLGFMRGGVWVQETLQVVSGLLNLGPFGFAQPTGPNRYRSVHYGEFEFAEGGANQNRAFSHSLQAELQAVNGAIQSPHYGQLTPNPWGIDHWVISQFFGLVHFGATGEQYAGWVSSERFGWMRFVDAGNGTRYLWVHQLQTWFSVNPDGSFHSFDFGWMVPQASSLTRYNSRIGILTVDLSDPQGWLRSDRFGYVWFARDGTAVWFWSETRKEWIGITSGGGLWSTKEGRFI